MDTKEISDIRPQSRRRSWMSRAGCFSPEAMLITMIIEFGGALWIAARYKLNQVGWLILALLVFLGGMQLSEFVICETGAAHYWPHIAYASITTLPPLGISLAMAIAGKKSTIAQVIMYVACGGFLIYWLLQMRGVDGATCGGNYVVFIANDDAMWLFGTYYYVLLAIGTFVSFYWGAKAANRRTSWALYWLAIGYIVFIVPTITVALLDPKTQNAIPSVMCGFALFLALTLLFFVAPRAATKRGDAEVGPGSGPDDSDDFGDSVESADDKSVNASVNG